MQSVRGGGHALALIIACAAAHPCAAPDSPHAGDPSVQVQEPAGFQQWQVKAFVAHGPHVFRERAAAAPLDASNYLMGSQACAVQADFRGAIGFLERGVAALPDAPGQFFFNLGQLHARVGNLSAARQSFAEGLRRDPTKPNYMEMLALLEEQFGDDRTGERLYKAAARYTSQSNQRAFRMNHVSLLLRAGRFQEVSSRSTRGRARRSRVADPGFKGGAVRVCVCVCVSVTSTANTHCASRSLLPHASSWHIHTRSCACVCVCVCGCICVCLCVFLMLA